VAWRGIIPTNQNIIPDHNPKPDPDCDLDYK
jgi:hypothetical protein